MISCAEGRFYTSLHDGTDFLRHVHWSAKPDLTIFDTGELPMIAMYHHRTIDARSVEVICDAPAEEDWDALFVNRCGSGKLGVDLCGSYRASAVHRELCCFLPAGADNRLHFDGDAGSFALYLKPGLIGSLLEDHVAGSEAPAPIVGRQMPQIANVLHLMESELRRPSLGSRLMIDGLLRALASLLLTNDTCTKTGKHERVYLSPPKLKRVIDFIEANLHDSIGLDDLAQAAGLSPNHFLRVFKLATGETPYHFLRARRLERARRLLADGVMPLAELALECGFANQAHFTAAFSREIGVSPGRYRRAMNS